MKWFQQWIASAVTVSWATAGAAVLWGAVGLVVIFGAVTAIRPAPKAIVQAIPESTTAVEGAAVVCVRAWLAVTPGTIDTLRPCFPADEVTMTAAPVPVTIGSATPVASAVTGPDYWSVTVAVEVTSGAPAATAGPGDLGQFTPTTLSPTFTRYYRVGMHRDGERYRAAAFPEPTGAPIGGAHPALTVGPLQRPAATDPIADTVQNYLAALLTGQGELSRYIWPNAPIRAVSPPPYASVRLLQMATVEVAKLRQEVLAEAEGTDVDGRVQRFAASLEVARRQGRWEVSKTLPAPSLSDNQPTSPPSTSPAPAPVPVAAATTTSTRLSPTTSTPSTTRP